MSANQAMSVAMVFELILRSAAALVFWKKGWRPRFPAMGIYLTLEAITSLFLLVSYVGMGFRHLFWEQIYFYSFWVMYVAGAVLAYFVCIEVIRSALASFPGLLRFGILIFRWLAIPSVIVVCLTLPPSHRLAVFIANVAYRLDCAIDVLQICLFSFLCLGLRALQLSRRHIGFGISISFAMLSASDLLVTFTSSPDHNDFTAWPQFVSEASQLLAQLIWIYYFTAPQPAPRRFVVSPTSRIYRWNEIASVLGNKGVQVAVSHPGENGLYSDLEELAEAALPDRKNHQPSSDS